MGPGRKEAPIFTTDTFAFLTELRAHNERPWFERHKERYEASVRQPMLELLGELESRLRPAAPHIVVDPRPGGGSMMRIYRDMRFSKDKSPYKTHAAAMLWHAAGKDSGAPGFYLHIEPGQTMFGGGVWNPEGPALKRIRDRIADHASQWRRVTSGLLKDGACALIGESLKRPPPGFDPEHPCIEDIKRKAFCVSMRFRDADARSPRFAAALVAGAKRMSPFMRFLGEAIGVPF